MIVQRVLKREEVPSILRSRVQQIQKAYGFNTMQPCAFDLVQFGVLVKLKESLLYVRSESGIWFTGTDAEIGTEHCQQVTSWSMKGLTDNLVPKEVMVFNDGYKDQAKNRFYRVKINLRYNSSQKVYESYLKVTPYHGRTERDMLDGEKPYTYTTTVKKRTSHRNGSRLNAQVAPAKNALFQNTSKINDNNFPGLAYM